MWLLHLSTLHFSLLTFKESIRPWHGLQGLAWSGSQLFFQSHFFLNSHPERERERERARERERMSQFINWLPSCTHPDQGLNPYPGYVPWPGICPVTFWSGGWHSNQLSHTDQGSVPLLIFSTLYHAAPQFLQATNSSPGLGRCASPGLEHSPVFSGWC